MPLQGTLDLKALRLRAGLTQSDLAARLAVAQSQIQRYETEPDNVPWRVVVEWVAACDGPSAAAGMDLGNPYAPADHALGLLHRYKASEPPLEPDDVVRGAVGLDELEQALAPHHRVPRLVVCGRVDAGKSRFVNTILGADKLPAAYQPTTRIPILVRHIKRKPGEQREPVWLMDEAFSLDQADDGAACVRHRLRAGDFDTLRLYAADGAADLPPAEGEAPASAVAYLDSPVLEACEILDTPGLGYTERDDALAKASRNGGDVVLYLSQLAGLFDGEDMRALPLLVERLAVPAVPGANPLARLFILVTHVHHGVDQAQAEQALDRAAARLHAALAPLLAAREGASGQAREISLTQVRARCFLWYAETPARSEPVLAELKQLLQDIAQSALRRMDGTVAAFRRQADEVLGEEADALERLANAHDAAARRLAEIEKAEPARRQERERRGKQILQSMDQGMANTADFVRREVAPMLGEPALLELVKTFKGQDEAKRDAWNEAMTRIRLKVTAALEREAAPLAKDIETYLEGFSFGKPGGAPGAFAFDARAAFLGAIAGIGTFGALAAWVALVAQGSNLGAYLVVPQIVGLLARLGIGIAGGTATGVSIVSALGGPVGIGIGIAVSVALLAWQAFGRSWQQRLASDFAQHMKKNDVQGKIERDCQRFWTDARDAFETAAIETEQKYAAYIDSLRERLKMPKAEIEARFARVRNRRAFLHYLPWPLVGGEPAS